MPNTAKGQPLIGFYMASGAIFSEQLACNSSSNRIVQHTLNF